MKRLCSIIVRYVTQLGSVCKFSNNKRREKAVYSGNIFKQQTEAIADGSIPQRKYKITIIDTPIEELNRKREELEKKWLAGELKGEKIASAREYQEWKNSN